MKLLHRLAADPGIIGILSKHRWTVGLLSEMPPEGKVGVSPVCILGVNINAGQEISLRLRTDDLKGFRRYLWSHCMSGKLRQRLSYDVMLEKPTVFLYSAFFVTMLCCLCYDNCNAPGSQMPVVTLSLT